MYPDIVVNTFRFTPIEQSQLRVEVQREVMHQILSGKSHATFKIYFDGGYINPYLNETTQQSVIG